MISLQNQFGIYPERVLLNEYEQQHNDHEWYEFECHARIARRYQFEQFVNDQQQSDQRKRMPAKSTPADSLFNRRPDVNVGLRQRVTSKHAIERLHLLQFLPAVCAT